MAGIEKIAISAAIGGTAEALGGGKFANGAVTGAYVMAFNHLMHPGEPKKSKLPALPENPNVTAVADETNVKNKSAEKKISLVVNYRFDLKTKEVYSLDFDPGDAIGLFWSGGEYLYDAPYLLEQGIDGNYWGLAIYTIDAAGGYYSIAVKGLYNIYQSDYMQGSLGNYFLKEYNYWKNSNPERARVYLKLSTEHYSNVKKR